VNRRAIKREAYNHLCNVAGGESEVALLLSDIVKSYVVELQPILQLGRVFSENLLNLYNSLGGVMHAIAGGVHIALSWKKRRSNTTKNPQSTSTNRRT